MRKIMLVIDEFNELEFLESLLRRLSFDVLSLSKDVSVPSAILGFFPDLVMAQAKSYKVDGVALSQKVRKLSPQARIVLLHPIGQPPHSGSELKNTVDAFLEMPVDPSKLITVLCQLGNFDEKVLQEKLSRIAAGRMSDEKRTRLQGKIGPSTPQETNMVGGGSGSRLQNDVVRVTSKNGNTSPAETKFGADASGTSEGAGGVLQHFQGTNTKKGPVHIAGERQEGTPAYDPTGEQEAAKRGGATYIPSETSTSGRQSQAGPAEVTERTKRYEAFLAAHDEPADKVIPQGEMKRQAKVYKLDLVTESGIDQKREFVRALFKR